MGLIVEGKIKPNKKGKGYSWRKFVGRFDRCQRWNSAWQTFFVNWITIEV